MLSLSIDVKFTPRRKMIPIFFHHKLPSPRIINVEMSQLNGNFNCHIKLDGNKVSVYCKVSKCSMYSKITFIPKLALYSGPRRHSSKRIAQIIRNDCYAFHSPHLGIINVYGKNFSELIET